MNVNKYFMIIEAMRFPGDSKDASLNAVVEKEILEHNLNILKSYLKDLKISWLDNCDNCDNCVQLSLNNELSAEVVGFQDSDLWSYVAYLQHVLTTIVKNINFDSSAKEDLISAKHMGLCIKVAQELAINGLQKQLHPAFYNDGGIYKQMMTVEAMASKSNYPLLYKTIEVFNIVLQKTQFHIANSMEFVVRDYMAGIFSLILAYDQKQLAANSDTTNTLGTMLNIIWRDFLRVHYFRNLLLFKGIPKLPMSLQRKIQDELLRKLRSEDGFSTLVVTIQNSWRGREKHRSKSTCNSQAVLQGDTAMFEVIANIVAHKSHSRIYQSERINQINKYLNACLKSNAASDAMSAGLLSLRRLYDLNDTNKQQIINLLDDDWKILTHPVDILTGLIMMDHEDFSLLVAKFFQIFCSSSIECLPSKILIRYVPLLLQLHHDIMQKFVERQQIADLIIRCLNNRNESELESLIEGIYKREPADLWLKLHPRVKVSCNLERTQLLVKMVSNDERGEADASSYLSTALTEIILLSQHHVLCYRIFMKLLKVMCDILLLEPITEESTGHVELLESEDDLVSYLNLKYPVKVQILISLNMFIEHQPLKKQLIEHAKDFLKFLRWLLEERLKLSKQQHSDIFEQTLLLVLALNQEFLEQIPSLEQYRDFLPTLRRLSEISFTNTLIKERIEILIDLLDGNSHSSDLPNSIAFNEARNLLESHQTHLQVYGMQMMLDLLKRRDVATLTNGHVIVALALNALKNKESYTFLNCVRLFVGLIDVMEAEVLELLSGEYLNEYASMDFRLVVGEAILKVCREMGPMIYKYKDVLLNCFMYGARSALDELRMSAFANLAQLCRILCYQVETFFQEMLNLIDCELSTGKYVPSQRAAILILSELLEGMDNLLEFEEMLLPIYRLLKILEANTNCDDKIRLHAANGLKALNEKCKRIFFPEQQLEKEIKIVGITDRSGKRRGKASILELD